jgi:nucleotide-binding universal stress UspA family protein
MTPHFDAVLVATDFSPTSVHALDYARMLAHRFDAPLHLLHVVEDPVVAAAWSEAYAVDVAGLRARLILEAEGRIKAQADALGDITVTTEVLVGSPARAIVGAAADRGAGLIVMGTHGRSGVTHWLLGSVAERVVRTAPCPVLTVRDAAVPDTALLPVKADVALA